MLLEPGQMQVWPAILLRMLSSPNDRFGIKGALKYHQKVPSQSPITPSAPSTPKEPSSRKPPNLHRKNAVSAKKLHFFSAIFAISCTFSVQF